VGKPLGRGPGRLRILITIGIQERIQRRERRESETETIVNMTFILLNCAFAFRIRMPALGGYREYDDRRLPRRMRVLETLVPPSNVLRSARAYDACE
jgi:hypothetical protein